jgi:hypothetical protein
MVAESEIWARRVAVARRGSAKERMPKRLESTQTRKRREAKQSKNGNGTDAKPNR